jgi:hypothetical protein
MPKAREDTETDESFFFFQLHTKRRNFPQILQRVRIGTVLQCPHLHAISPHLNLVGLGPRLSLRNKPNKSVKDNEDPCDNSVRDSTARCVICQTETSAPIDNTEYEQCSTAPNMYLTFIILASHRNEVFVVKPPEDGHKQKGYCYDDAQYDMAILPELQTR